MGWASRNRQGPGPKERPHWWRTRRGRSFALHPAEALTDQNRRSGGTSEDWGWRGGTGGGPGPMDIEVARRQSHEPTAVRAGARTRMAGIYSTLDRHNMLGRITRLPRWSRRDVLAGARLDRVDGGGSRWTGPTRNRSQDLPLEVGSRYGADRQR